MLGRAHRTEGPMVQSHYSISVLAYYCAYCVLFSDVVQHKYGFQYAEAAYVANGVFNLLAIRLRNRKNKKEVSDVQFSVPRIAC